jgi:hypothetical protein
MTVKLADISLPKSSITNYAAGMDLIPFCNKVLRAVDEHPELASPKMFRHEISKIIVSAVRFALLNEDCDKIPLITELRVFDPARHTPDQWGSTHTCTLEYASRGWMVTLGGKILPGGQMEWTVYAD